MAFVFGPENGAVSEKLVHAALQEAQLKSYAHLYVIGFAIQPHARQLIDNAAEMGRVPATYVQATPDLMMGDLLKNMRSSQIFSVCGLPEIKVHESKPAQLVVHRVTKSSSWASTRSTRRRWTPTTGRATTCRAGCSTRTTTTSASALAGVLPAHGGVGRLKKALKADYDESVWDHLAGTGARRSRPASRSRSR